MMFIVLELNQLLLVVHTQLIITVYTLRMLESGVTIVIVSVTAASRSACCHCIAFILNHHLLVYCIYISGYTKTQQLYY